MAEPTAHSDPGPGSDDLPAAPDAVLARASEVVLRYGPHVAVRASSFTIPAGGITAIIGPNGSGKSTVLRAMAGLLAPVSGTLRVLGTSAAEARSRVSFVPQTMAVPIGTPITVAETVAMGRYSALGLLRRMGAVDRERVRFAMECMEITDLGRRHLAELSGGQLQRVYVAQGIAQDHEVLLLDEPLTGLDLVSAQTIDRIIHSERNRGHSVVLTTHDLEEASAADSVVLMSGRVVASGPPEQVLTRRNLETAYGLGALHEPGPRDRSQIVLDDPTHQRECIPH
jgi:manganese transport system ATP-binding protein